ncbi:MAG: nitroreductase family protein [Oscillospiraceae bacterium]|nr:nitroreductase family protein [Oscillospiraceae bacterium]
MIDNEVIRTIMARRSTKGFREDPIPQEFIDTIVETGRNAPNAFNYQKWEFYVVSDREWIRKESEISAKLLGGEPSDHVFYNAPVIIIIVDDRGHRTPFQDAGCAMENMFIAAQSLGLGSCWINQFMTINDEPEVIDLLKEIGIDETKMVTALGAFGYPAKPPKDKEIVSKVHYVK